MSGCKSDIRIGVKMTDMIGVRALVAICVAMPSGIISAQSGGVEASHTTTVCEIVKSPASFNGKIVTLRSPIQIAFENFGLSTSECAGKKLDYVWLEYGRGPKRQPTTWCCGDMVPRDPLVLLQNQDFHRFHVLITARKKAKGCHDCYLYR